MCALHIVKYGYVRNLDLQSAVHYLSGEKSSLLISGHKAVFAIQGQPGTQAAWATSGGAVLLLEALERSAASLKNILSEGKQINFLVHLHCWNCFLKKETRPQ